MICGIIENITPTALCGVFMLTGLAIAAAVMPVRFAGGVATGSKLEFARPLCADLYVSEEIPKTSLKGTILRFNGTITAPARYSASCPDNAVHFAEVHAQDFDIASVATATQPAAKTRD